MISSRSTRSPPQPQASRRPICIVAGTGPRSCDPVPESEAGLARNTDPTTSHEAARRVKVTEQEELVLRVMRAHPQGLTADQVGQLTGRDKGTMGTRISQLVRKGFLTNTGTRIPTSSGCNAEVRSITADGIARCVNDGFDQWDGAKLSDFEHGVADRFRTEAETRRCQVCGWPATGGPGPVPGKPNKSLTRHLLTAHGIRVDWSGTEAA